MQKETVVFFRKDKLPHTLCDDGRVVYGRPSEVETECGRLERVKSPFDYVTTKSSKLPNPRSAPKQVRKEL